MIPLVLTPFLPSAPAGCTRRRLPHGVLPRARRVFSLLFGFLVLWSCFAGTAFAQSKLAPADDSFLDEVQRAATLYFWEAADPSTGLIKDRALADGSADSRSVASIAATGFGLTALCIAEKRGFTERAQIRDRVLTTLNCLSKRLPREHGFYYHFLDVHTGDRVWKCELSSIDTALLLCGVLTCRQHFTEPEITNAASRIYERIDWPWMLNGGSTFSHGWKPESGFLKGRWDTYSELMMIYLLALGSPTHPAPPQTWDAWKRPSFEYAGLRYINPEAPLFIHQYSQGWFDFRGRHDRHTDYFANSVLATKAHRQFCLDLRSRFKQFSEELWGITASDSARGYVAWGGPAEQGPLDGTLVPCAAGGSIPFLPVETLRTLRAMREKFGQRVWKRYGFIDAFNPHAGWYAPDVIGIDVGIMMLMAENARSGFVWETFMRNVEMREAMKRAGFSP